MLATSVQNALSRDDEIAFLREQVALLKKTLAGVEHKLKQLGGGAKDNDAVLGRETPVPELPNETWLHVGSFLQPGSRALLNLISTCRTLYELLLPRLLEKIDSKLIIVDHRFHVYRDAKYPLLSQHVKEMRLYSVTHPLLDDTVTPDNHFSSKVVSSCRSNLKRLYLDMTGLLRPDLLFDGVFRSLEILELENAIGRFNCAYPGTGYPVDWESKFPKLRSLRIHMVIDTYFYLHVFEGMTPAFCQHLEKLDLNLTDRHTDLATLPAVVSKITNYFVGCMHSFRALLATQEFKPTVLETDDAQAFWPWHEDDVLDELYSSLTKLDSLKSLSMGNIAAETIIEYGFPPNLEVFQSTGITLMAQDCEAARRLRATLPPRLRLDSCTWCTWRFDEQAHVPRKGTRGFDGLLEELLLWSRLMKRGDVLNVDILMDEIHDEDGKDDEEEFQNRLGDIEQEFKKRDTVGVTLDWNFL